MQPRLCARSTWVGSSGFWSFGGVLIAGGTFALCLSGRVGRVLSVVERRARDLAMLANVLARLEEVTGLEVDPAR